MPNRGIAVSIVIPAYNEDANLVLAVSKFIQQLRSLSRSFELIIVDDGSHDNTGILCDNLARDHSFVKVFHHSINRGYGSAIRTGIANALGEVTVIVDADMQNDPKDIDKILAEIDRGYEVVVGWRKVRMDTFFRKFASRVYNSLVSTLFGLKLHDINGKPKAFTRKVLASMPIENSSWLIDLEIISKAKFHNFRICEVPVAHRSRWKGHSKLTLRSMASALFFALIFRFKLLMTFEKKLVEEHFDNIAYTYDALDMRGTALSRDETFMKLVDAFKGKLILDMGGGTGRLGGIASKEGLMYINVDISRRMLAIARNRLPRSCVLVRGDVEHLPFKDRIFDTLICNELLEHLPDPSRAVQEASRVLAYQGHLLLSNPNPVWMPVLFLAEKIQKKPREGPHAYIAPWKLRRLLKSKGLNITEQFIMPFPFSNPLSPSWFNHFLRKSVFNNLAIKHILVCSTQSGK